MGRGGVLGGLAVSGLQNRFEILWRQIFPMGIELKADQVSDHLLKKSISGDPILQQVGAPNHPFGSSQGARSVRNGGSLGLKALEIVGSKKNLGKLVQPAQIQWA